MTARAKDWFAAIAVVRHSVLHVCFLARSCYQFIRYASGPPTIVEAVLSSILRVHSWRPIKTLGVVAANVSARPETCYSLRT